MMRARTLVGLMSAAVALGGVVVGGCSKKPDTLDVQAPPPSNPNAQREVALNKKRPAPPPTMGQPPSGKQ